MTVADRRATIESVLASRGEMSLDELAARFEVSQMTIRRDLEALESRGVLRRLAGGGVLATKSETLEPAFRYRAIRESQPKAHIGRAIAHMLRDGECVYFDGGSTALAAAAAVRECDLRLTIVTPSTLAALELVGQPQTDVTVLGGQLRPGELTTVGSETERALDNYNFDTMVMGVGGVHVDRGVTDYHRGEAAVKQRALQHATRVILAADQTKLGRVLHARIGPISVIDTLVTDAPRDLPMVVKLEQAGTRIVCVEAEDAD